MRVYTIETSSMKIKFIYLFAALLTSVFSFSTDYGVGDWKVHVPYRDAKGLAVTSDRIYVNSEYGLFYFDKATETLTTVSKLDGLTGSAFSYIAYDVVFDRLLICYEDGNIDLYSENDILSITDIERSSIVGSKTINHALIVDDKAYLSCDFGLVLLDLEKGEVKESFINIGEEGSSVEIYASAISSDGDSIFVTTSEGIKTASLSSQYILQDNSNWEHISFPVADTENRFIGVIGGRVYVPIKNEGVYYYNGTWTKSNITVSHDYRNLSVGHECLLLPFENTVIKITSSGSSTLNLDLSYGPNFVTTTSSGEIALCSQWAGLVYSSDGSSFSNYAPNGPQSNNIFNIKSIGDDLYSLQGGRSLWSPTGNPGQVNLFSEGEWDRIDVTGTLTLTDVLYDPNRNHIFYCSMGYGVREYTLDHQLVNMYNDTTGNCPFINALNLDNYSSYWNFVKITEARMDDDGNIWFINTETRGQEVLHKLKPDDTWESYRPTGDDVNYPVELEIDGAGNKWLHLEGPDGLNKIVVYNEITGEQIEISTKIGEGELPDATVNDITIDLDDNIWVATNKGVAVFYDASNIFNGSSVTAAVTPIFEGRPLLEDEIVNSITIDGGNRKWFGTNNGAFLFSESGTENVLSFNEDNSALLSNSIITIGVNNATGEVFFGTQQGIVSYWNDATLAVDEHVLTDNNELKIFPNPVPPNFEGEVGIVGLARDAQVKITDISGKVVYEDYAEGGMLTWDVNDTNGDRVSTGVYLVFSSSSDGEETFVGKLAVVK